MGCDIHLHVEFKVAGQWYHYSHPSVDRNYRLLAKMAGIRDDYGIVPLALPRGIPADVSFTTRFDCDVNWRADGHSHSYLTSQEVVELGDWSEAESWVISLKPDYERIFWFELQFGFFFGNSFPGFHKYPEDHLAEIEDFRFVFWFDN